MVHRMTRISLGVIVVACIFIIGFFLERSINSRQSNIRSIVSPSRISNDVRPKTDKFLETFSFAYNKTHLWSMRLADDTYHRVASSIPCRTVEYTGGPTAEKMNHCDTVMKQEFTVESTLEIQKWLYDHQHPSDCSKKRIGIIHQFAWSGFGSTIHQIVWAFGVALSQDRIAVYQTPGNWIYGNCGLGTPDCVFLPISNCSVPSAVDGDRVVRIKADFGHWNKPVIPEIFRNHSFNWLRSQILFYLMRYNPQTLSHVERQIAAHFVPPSLNDHRPFVSVYVRRSDKVQFHEMSQAYKLAEYFSLFDNDARRANISTIFLNSEDALVFDEYRNLSADIRTRYKLLSINVTRNVVFRSLVRWSGEAKKKIVLEFLTGLFIEANADLHVGTLTSNWCRLVDEMRLALGKVVPYYTPEKKYLLDW